MKLNYPGLTTETMPSGKIRIRVRVKGNKGQKVTLTCGLDDPQFGEQYLAARMGIKPAPNLNIQDKIRHGSLAWLIAKHLAHYQKMVDQGRKSPKTINKKRYLLNPYLKHDDMIMLIPRKKLEQMRDEMADRPSQADAFIEAFRVMYDWAIKQEYISENPARLVDKIAVRGSGAKPWTAKDVQQYLNHHPIGSKAHTALQVLLWTGCRIEDLTHIGRHNEIVIDGTEAIQFQPMKKGSAIVTLPLSPAMKEATRANKVQGKTYILGRGGSPYASGDSMSNMFIRWCRDAGVQGKSAHGIRKAVGEILAELGATQYEIMAVHGHTESRTSEVYTKSVSRFRLAKKAMERMEVDHRWK